MTKAKSNPKPVSCVNQVSRKKLRSPIPAPKLAGKNLERAVEQFQSEPDEQKAHEQWKQIEASVFGVRFED